jgi:nucleotide-binding universal stress UspA family protein
MGTKGATGLKEVFFGTVTAATIGRSKIPVLAVPFEYLLEEQDAIVFATSRFEENKRLLKRVVELARLFRAVIHTVVFVNADTNISDQYLHNEKQMNQYLAFLKENYPDVSFTGKILLGKKFEQTIEAFENKNEVDMIAMITYPKSFWERMLRKSYTMKMAFHSKIPVLAVPAT